MDTQLPAATDRVSNPHSVLRPLALNRWLMPALWTLGLSLATLHSWPRRYSLGNLDSVSYLDLADAWRTGQWQDAINTYWSPGYSWVLAAAIGMVDPSPPNEYVLLHIVNLALFVVVLAAFHLLIVELLRTRDAGGEAAALAPASYLTLGALVFFWMMIVQQGVWRESPDLIPAAATFAGAALVIRLGREPRVWTAFALGAVLGVGYLGKAAMLPAAPVFILAAAAPARSFRLRTVIVASLGLLAVAGPWILMLSIVTGRPTFGDSGRINYLWYVNRSEDWPRHWPPHWPHWDGVEGRGAPVHPARRLHERPAVYEFAEPFTAATYPMWYAPGYWYEGVTPQLDLVDQLRRIKLSASELLELFTLTRDHPDYFNPQPAIAALLLVLWFGAARRRWRIPWAIVIPALSVIALYASVRIAPRFVTAPMVVVWLAVLAGVRLAPQPEASRLLRGATLAGVIVLGGALLIATASETYPGMRRMMRGEADVENIPWRVASQLRDAGITAGTPVGVIGNAQVASRWLRLTKSRIVAEVPRADADLFVNGDPATMSAVLDAFRRTPARAILAEGLPESAGWSAWTRVSGTPYALLWLDR